MEIERMQECSRMFKKMNIEKKNRENLLEVIEMTDPSQIQTHTHSCVFNEEISYLGQKRTIE